jgi:hypothetical protein
MRILNKYFLILIILSCSLVYSKPRAGNYPIPDNIAPPRNPVPDVVTQQVGLDANNIASWFYNTGIFNQDLRVSDHPGLMWPNGSGKYACFTAGLSIGAYVNNVLREAMCSYAGEYAPGYVDNTGSGDPVVITDSRFRIYKVTSTSNNNEADYAQWGDMIPFGAPYDDVNHNGHYDPGTDKPGRKDAAMTLFACLTDGFPEEHKAGEGFGGGTLPLFVEMHFTAWAYTSPGLEDIQFINWVVINKSKFPWKRTYMGVTVDPDLGYANDDYIGCDTALNMGFCYNGDNDDDQNASPYAYGPNPPAFGMDYFTSPVNHSVNPPYGDTLGLTSFVYFTNTSTPGPACEKDPNGEQIPAYYMLQGLKKDQSAWVVPPGGDSSYITKYCYPGDPESGNGWTEGLPGNPSGSIQNCAGLNGSQVQVNPVGDRRFIFNSGAENFLVYPYGVPYNGETHRDSINIVLAQFVARGSSNLNSVTQLKRLDKVAQKIFDANFNVIPPPPKPDVHTSIRQTSDRGTFEVTFSWTDASEKYNYKDTLFQPDSVNARYVFEGYEIYELRNSATSLPDLAKPESINNDIKQIAIFDRIDSVGIIIDTFSTGTSPGGLEQYAPFPVIPIYRSPSPQGFPNTGLSRNIIINKTLFNQDYEGHSELIYGHTYKFAIMAYAYNTHPLRGQAIIRNSLLASVITITPEAPLAGSEFIYKDGDTLSTSRRDLGMMPIVKNQEILKNASYRIVFQNPDTTYNILRSFDNWNTSQTIKTNLKYVQGHSTHDDSSRIVDGLLLKVEKIRYAVPVPIATGNYTGNVGVIHDPDLIRDSIQTRYYGWDYNPPEHKYLEGSKFTFSGRLWQSKSMSISYPTRNTYTGFRSLLNPEDLRTVKIVFTGYGSGQMAYRYIPSSDETFFMYQDMKEVPIKVFEISNDDSSAGPRQLNCAFLEFPDSSGGHLDGKWDPTADSLGGKEVLYIFSSNYNSNPDPYYTTKNLRIQQPQVDIMYVWSPKLIAPGATFNVNDEFIIYPYTVTRPLVVPGHHLYYQVDVKAPVIGDPNIAAMNNDLSKITIVPNPYYGFNSLETPTSGRFVTFRRLPKQVTIKIYTINGDLIKTLEKNNNDPTLRWDMTNLEDVPIASGIYICLIDAPGIGTKVLKAAIFTPQERINF